MLLIEICKKERGSGPIKLTVIKKLPFLGPQNGMIAQRWSGANSRKHTNFTDFAATTKQIISGLELSGNFIVLRMDSKSFEVRGMRFAPRPECVYILVRVREMLLSRHRGGSNVYVLKNIKSSKDLALFYYLIERNKKVSIRKCAAIPCNVLSFFLRNI